MKEPSDICKRLTPEQQQAYMRDLTIFGYAMVRTEDDGSLTYIPSEAWRKNQPPLPDVRKIHRKRMLMSAVVALIVALGVFVLLGLLEPQG